MIKYSDGSSEEIDKDLAKKLIAKFDFKIFHSNMPPEPPFSTGLWIMEALPKSAPDPTAEGAWQLVGKVSHEEAFSMLL